MDKGKTIPGIPETISRSDYLALIESLGLDIKDLKMLELRRDGIYATVMARNAEGKLTADPATRETNVHRIYIPVVDDIPGE
jgi:hypothetical protein